MGLTQQLPVHPIIHFVAVTLNSCNGMIPLSGRNYPSTSAFVYLPGRDNDLGTLHPAVAGENTQCFLDFECWEMPNVCLNLHESIPKLQNWTFFLDIPAKTMH